MGAEALEGLAPLRTSRLADSMKSTWGGRSLSRRSDGRPPFGNLCVSQAPSGTDNVGCGHGLVDVSSIVTSVSE